MSTPTQRGAKAEPQVAGSREAWEFVPTPEHKSLVLLLYRNIIKGLVDFKSIRRRSLIAYCRFAFRRRSMATEKLLIDECIEEARRAIYVLQKHHNFTRTHTYEYDSMGIPRDTGQDVATYMEEVYDPELSRQQFQHFQDVQPGREYLHQQRGLGPTSGQHHWHEQRSSAEYRVEIREEDKALRPPPPPTEGV
ncbi:unnamed protein product [Trypanosoma congolense IL3000]|uniref:WGS project CAEQ00000000 data, annotated contig 2328 n=1 Tax=Trypanosoma congolense (strain IL3000) TaxID=1068625 RepID=F9WD67_TRYCI|nr:unnamed protein product [Trypanosoma congolense IL3000]